jgi:hypothetical protein
MRSLVRILFVLPLAASGLQWLLYFSYRSHDCAGRPNLVHQRQAILCLTNSEQFLWNGVGGAVAISFAALFAVIAALAIPRLFKKVERNRD